MGAGARVRSSDVELGIRPLSIEHAIDNLVGAAQGVVENQIGLARLEVEVTLGRMVRSGGLVAAGAFLIAVAIVALAMAAYVVLPPAYTAAQRLAVVAAASGFAGILVASIGVRRMGSHGGG
jgi:putative superfamily III holin-X